MAGSKWTKIQIKGLDAILKRLGDSVKSFDQKTADDIGQDMLTKILKSVERGISPIEGRGRFEEYKASAKKNQGKRLDKKIKELQKHDKTLVGRLSQRFGITKHTKADLKTLKDHARAQKEDSKKGYPYNTKQYRDGSKRPRPVNLFLTGDFLGALTWFMVEEGGKFQMKFGWLDNTNHNLDKEQGHREGAGGQPERPIIPVGSETYSRAIILGVKNVFRERLIQWLKK